MSGLRADDDRQDYDLRLWAGRTGDRGALLRIPGSNDEKIALVNRTFGVIERDCLPIETAARLVVAGAFP
jgi:hypothetical protein